uniref:TIR domain-containing protein n=1 Tax=Xiphophorus couchianus TaxID=32473 RepID=A0A3B5KQR6_9TELE
LLAVLKMFLILSFLAFISGELEWIYVRAGDLVMLQCEECKYDGTVVLWKLETGQKTQLYSNMSASEQQRLGLVLYQNRLVILSASLNHQGNYSCGPLRRIWMKHWLTVYSESSREAEFGNRYSQTCYKNQTCELNCPEENLPSDQSLWIGVYFCTRSFLYSGQTYNASFTVVLDVQTGIKDPLFTRLSVSYATLVFREVLAEDLSTNFSCKLESAELTRFVSVTLDKTASFTTAAFSLRSDENSYDAFLMCYKSITDGGLSEEDRKCLASTLEDEFGYSICLYDRDVLPGQAVADAVLDCIQQSRAVVLIPGFPDPEPGSAVLSAIHSSLVERKTRLIFINTEQTEASTSGSFPEALQLLSKAGNSVTWKGRPPPTSFWKQLRYHLPAPQQTPKMQLLSQEC